MAGSFDVDDRAQFLDHLRGGMMLGAAAFVLELPRHVVEGYIAENAEFALEVKEAEDTATEHVQEAVYQAAVSGNVQAAKLWFEIRGRRRRPTRPPSNEGAKSEPPGDGDPEAEAALRDLDL